MAAPGLDTLQGLRDTAIIATMLCTGIREQELCDLDVPDLYGQLGEELALVVRHGKGDKQRLIPYGELDWLLVLLESWMDQAGSESGPVFRSYYKGFSQQRPGRMSGRSVERLLKSYPISADGKLITVTPHDLRRTYARLMYEGGMELVAIQQNLGHADLKTTMRYIGELDAQQRRGRAVFGIDLSALPGTQAADRSSEATGQA